MNMRSFLLILFGTAALYAPPSFAGSIESEPLAPPPGQQGSSGVTPAPIPSNTEPAPIPLTTRAGAPASTKPPAGASSSGSGNGMDGGATSAYDLGTPATAPVTSRERDMGTADSTGAASAPAATEPEPYKIPVRDNQVIRMGSAPPEDKALENVKFCTLKISFSSMGSGIDTKTDEQIKAYLASNADKLAYTTASFGREGEHSYCIDVNQHNLRAKTYTDLKRLLPPKGMNAPETKLSGEGFVTVTNSR